MKNIKKEIIISGIVTLVSIPTGIKIMRAIKKKKVENTSYEKTEECELVDFQTHSCLGSFESDYLFKTKEGELFHIPDCTDEIPNIKLNGKYLIKRFYKNEENITNDIVKDVEE